MIWIGKSNRQRIVKHSSSFLERNIVFFVVWPWFIWIPLKFHPNHSLSTVFASLAANRHSVGFRAIFTFTQDFDKSLKHDQTTHQIRCLAFLKSIGISGSSKSSCFHPKSSTECNCLPLPRGAQARHWIGDWCSSSETMPHVSNGFDESRNAGSATKHAWSSSVSRTNSG